MESMSPRAFALALLLALPPALAVDAGGPLDGPRPAAASVAITLSLEQLVTGSAMVVVATAAEQRSQWEDLGGARRIVTYTRLTIDRTVEGEPGKEIWVRTLGGAVGKIGQLVSGDARITIGSQALLFLARTRDGALKVTGMAQGHYPLVAEDPPAGGTPAARPKRLRLAASPDSGAILPRPGPAISAREVLVGATLDDAVEAIRRARRASSEMM
jgi:hypothetical protein